MKRFFLVGLYILVMGFFSSAHQSGDKGIVWTKGLTWQQVKEKASKENKYIFLDCFATWCGPCKEMDKVVYPNDTVGDFFNERFISVKVQMDKLQNDNEQVKSWYADAEEISDQYRVLAFPTYIFLAPDGRIVHKDGGYKAVDKFIATAAIALRPGQVYVDKYEEFDRLEADYKAGKKVYDRMLYMAQAADELKKTALSKVLKTDYLAYLEGLDKKKVFTKENLLFLGNQVGLTNVSPLFNVFYSDRKKVDRVVGKGYARIVISKAIYREITVPFLKLRPRANIMGGKRDSAEADWDSLYARIRKRYSREYAEIGVLEAKVVWYEQHYNYPPFFKAYLEKLERCGIDTFSTPANTAYAWINFHCWRIFLSLDDQLLLFQAAKRMRQLAKQKQMRDHYLRMQMMDTYANLLYKTGKKVQAMSWEEQAITFATELQSTRHVENYTAVLSKMRNGQPTWSVRSK